LIISGDIAEGEVVCRSLKDFNNSFDFPVYFVLGNHDFYHGSFAEFEKNIRDLVKDSENLHWLSESGVVKLNDSTALIGVEGWGDARNGNLNLSEGAARDILAISDYKGLSREEIKLFLNKKGDRYAALLKPVLTEAVENFEKVILVTHVPPFVEVCLDRSLRICGEFKLPFYTCKAIGDMLLEVMNENPACEMTVLCGHTHEKADAQILGNLRVRVKESGYGSWWDATLIDLDKL
jgi:predicted phosphohydrolase